MDAYERRTGFYGIGKFFEELGIIRLVDDVSAKTEGSPFLNICLAARHRRGVT
jgi:hypothetical protein